jgi:hypothetical protein
MVKLILNIIGDLHLGSVITRGRCTRQHLGEHHVQYIASSGFPVSVKDSMSVKGVRDIKYRS